MQPCKECGFTIILGGDYKEQLAQEGGFCGTGCELFYKRVKEIAMEMARRAA